MDPMAMMQQMNESLNQQGQSSENWTVAYIPEAIAQNMQVVNTSRTMTSLIAGCTAGILGISGYTNGIAFYLFITLITSFFLARKSNFKYSEYFVDKQGPLLEGLTKGVMTYIMFWTLMFDVTHVYNSSE